MCIYFKEVYCFHGTIMCISFSQMSTTELSLNQFNTAHAYLIISFCSLQCFRRGILPFNKNVMCISCFPCTLHFWPSSKLVCLGYLTTLFEHGKSIASSNMMMDESWIANDLQENDRGLIEVLTGIFLEGLKKITKNLSQDGRCAGRYLKQAPPKCKSSAGGHWSST
jgi:hypothetical protein